MLFFQQSIFWKIYGKAHCVVSVLVSRCWTQDEFIIIISSSSSGVITGNIYVNGLMTTTPNVDDVAAADDNCW